MAIIVCGIILGIQFIHSKCMIHRNLQPSNILIDERGFARIGDFESSRLFDMDITSAKHVGSPVYMAPEMFKDEKYTNAVDVYSFTLILYELLVGESVFQSTIPLGTLMDTVPRGIGTELPASMNETVKDIIQKGWAVDPSMRCSFEEIWSRLASINFQLTPNVNSSRVFRFISWVRMNGPELAPVASLTRLPVPEPSARADMPFAQGHRVVRDGFRYMFWAPQREPNQFSLECERCTTVADVRQQVADHLGYRVKLVQLLFGGRILRDSLVLANLEIDDGIIVVHARKQHNPLF
jgi:serine/threonine protein kinase